MTPLLSLASTANFALALTIVGLTLAAQRSGKPRYARSWIFFGLAALSLLAHASFDLLGVDPLAAAATEALTSAFLGVGLVFLYGADHEAMRAVERQADVDGLTGLLNLRAFAAAANQRLAAVATHGGTVALAIFDVDSFKSINDSFGHPMGDRVLQAVATAIRSQLRTPDLACRYGGDEFIVLVDRCDDDESERIVRRVLRATAVLTQPLGAEVTLSAGLASFPVSGSDLGSLIQRADEMLLSAKRSGKNDVRREGEVTWPVRSRWAEPRPRSN